MAPSAAPAPTIVWSSSINMMIFPAFLISSITAFIRSSNCPRYFVPATIRAKSSVIRRLSTSISGMTPLAISWASPSAIAVLPTPASPIRTGLFLVRRHKICITRRISDFRPTTGSNSPFLASSVKSLPKAFNAGVLVSFFSSPD